MAAYDPKPPAHNAATGINLRIRSQPISPAMLSALSKDYEAQTTTKSVPDPALTNDSASATFAAHVPRIALSCVSPVVAKSVRDGPSRLGDPGFALLPLQNHPTTNFVPYSSTTLRSTSVLACGFKDSTPESQSQVSNGFTTCNGNTPFYFSFRGVEKARKWASTNFMSRFPPEIREMILLECFKNAEPGETPAIVKALRCKRELYGEALVLFSNRATLGISDRNLHGLSEMNLDAWNRVRSVSFSSGNKIACNVLVSPTRTSELYQPFLHQPAIYFANVTHLELGLSQFRAQSHQIFLLLLKCPLKTAFPALTQLSVCRPGQVYRPSPDTSLPEIVGLFIRGKLPQLHAARTHFIQVIIMYWIEEELRVEAKLAHVSSYWTVADGGAGKWIWPLDPRYQMTSNSTAEEQKRKERIHRLVRNILIREITATSQAGGS